uniref:RRM domain-containing protein n=1 Tax=Hyaloperonospora arabidopsidis (strain Emoy2) TaxID=559515 RepID=M4BDY3_HYAAE
MNNADAPSSVTRTTATTTDPQYLDHPRLFVVCGRSCKMDELRALFSTCGLIKHLHLALDRSKKSRYEDPEDAFAAIDTLDHMKLDDGHILKVTVAKERPVSGNGKVKRDQHARLDLDEKIEGVRQQEDDGGIEARLPGKRQRSSPPVVALPLGSSRATPVLDNQQLRICQLGVVNATSEKTETSLVREKHVLTADVCKDELVVPEEDQIQVEQVMCAMLVAVEKREVPNKTNDDLLAMYLRVGSTLDQVKRQRKDENCKIVRPGLNEVSKEGKSTNSLAPSVRSGPLVPTPMKIRKVLSDALQRADGVATRNGGAMPPHNVKQHLRRRRQSLEIAGSSTEDTSDGSGIRRKRSNTTTSPSPTQTAHVHTKFKALPPVEKPSDRSDVGLSPDATNAKVTLKKLCKRQSSENGIEGLYRSTKQRATEDRRDHDSFVVDRRQDWPATTKLEKSCVHDRSIKLESESKPAEPVHTKLFFTSTYKGDEDPERPEFMTREKPAQFHAGTALKCTSTSQSGHPLAKKPEPPISAILPSAGKDRLWVFLMYDRFLTTHMLSSVVSSLSGMEFMDIEVVKSTGETQGIAFVKFDSDTNATQAAHQLHQLELPLGSGKFLQAIAVQAPSLFSPSHESNSTSTQRLERTAVERAVLRSFEDTDLRVVEARFAHLMRSTEHSGTGEDQYFHHYSRIPSPGDATMGNQQSPMAAGVYTHSDGLQLGSSAGLEYHPMQLMTYPSPPSHQYFHPYTSLGPGHWQQLAQHQGFGGNAPGWTETAPYYQDGTQQYPFACTPDQELTFPVPHDSNNMRRVEDSITAPLKPRYPRALSEQVGVEGTNSKCSNYTSRSIHVSTSEPLELVSLVSALQKCPGLVSFAKSVGAESDRTSYTVDFSNEAQASEALCKLDGTLCRGQKLRVAKHTSTRHRGTGGGGKPRSGSGRRKRQRVDPRNRK